MTNTPDTLREIDLVRASHVTKQSSGVTESNRTELADALEIAAMCNPIRCYEGALWFGRNQNFADATFVDHGAARAFVNIVNAAPDLLKALVSVRNWLDVQHNETPRPKELTEQIKALNTALLSAGPGDTPSACLNSALSDPCLNNSTSSIRGGERV